MGRPRGFDEDVVLEAAVRCFWSRGFEATSIKELSARTGLSAASLYNAYGDKRGLFRTALDRYVEESIGARIRRCEVLPPREGIRAFFDDILARSLKDRECKGCMLVNSALEVAPHDPEFRDVIAAVLLRLESFFVGRIREGQGAATITSAISADVLAQHLLGVLMGVRVLARVRPERALLEGVVAPALALLDMSATIQPASGGSDRS